MIFEQIKKASENLIKTWLRSSIGAGSLVSQRDIIDSALKLELIERLMLVQFEKAIPSQSRFCIELGEDKSVLIVKSFPTLFDYKNCIEYDALHDQQLQKINIGKNLLDISNGIINDNKYKNIYYVLVVYPCTNNDIDWQIYLDYIKNLSTENFEYYDFRFSNNIPGCLYVGKMNSKNRSSNTNLNTPENKNITSFGDFQNINQLKKGTYTKILIELQKEMLDKEPIRFEELQELFENRVIDELKKENPKIDKEIIKDSKVIVKFNSKGTGAKKAQILLHTINEKNRIFYRPRIEENSNYNLFYYTESNFENIPIRKRLIKAFQKDDLNAKDITIFFNWPKKDSEKTSLNDKLVKDVYKN